MNKTFENFRKGLNILNKYNPECLEISPIPSSFPNGAPNHSSSAFVSVAIADWPMGDAMEELMQEYGWIMEQEGYWWVFKG